MTRCVVHVNLKRKHIAGCYDIVERILEKNCTNRPMTQVVRELLEGLVIYYQQAGMIPERDDLNAARRLEELSITAQGATIPRGLDPDKFRKSLAEDDQDDEGGDYDFDPSEIGRAVEEELESRTNPDASIGEVEISETVDSPRPGVDLTQVERTPLKVLAKKAPKDKRIVEIQEAQKPDSADAPDPQYVAAVEITYTHLDPLQWGHEVADRHITTLLRQAQGG